MPRGAKLSGSRFYVLRGMGATIALPLLDAMVPALAASPPPTKRLGFIYMPNGVAMNFSGVNYWAPHGTGKERQIDGFAMGVIHEGG